MMLVLLAVFALAGAQLSPPVTGTAELTVDLTGLARDVQVSIDDRDVYRDQGGQIRTYTVRTSNDQRGYQVVITEGAAASVTRVVQLRNGDSKTLTGFRATLRIHLEKYSVPQGNTFSVKLRVNVNAANNVFREYSTVPGAPYRLPLTNLFAGYPHNPTPNVIEVTVLAVDTDVTVWAGEYHQGRLAVSVVGHNGNGLVVDPTCSDFQCDSGRLVARATAALTCNGSEDYPLPQTDRLQLLSTPSPTVTPVELVREWTNVAPDTYIWWVLAANNYQVHAEKGDVEKVSALNCAIGECEANPLTSIFSVWHNVLRGNLAVSVKMEGSFVPFNTYATEDADVTKICVYNLPLTRVVASFETGGVVDSQPINCGDTDQVCKTFVYAVVTPNYSCLPDSGVELATVVVDRFNQRVYQRWGVVTPTLIVPALPNLELQYYDGATEWTPAGHHPSVVNAQATFSTPLSDCSAVIDTDTRHQDGNAPGACGPPERTDRMLSIFDLAFLPAVEAGYTGDGQLPPNGDSNNITVTFQNDDGQVWRFLPNQGGAPRMYCVLPVELESKIEEKCSCFTSETVSCVAVAAEGADCSVCDFLSILEYDLTGLPREVNSIIYAGPRDGEHVVVVDENFNEFDVPSEPCEKIVDGSSINFENRYPASSNIEVWRQGCNGSPTHLPDGTPTGNTLKIGNMQPYHDGVPEPLPFVNNTCVTFKVPHGVSQINVKFYAWQHGNGNNDTNAWVRAFGKTSGTSLKSWIQVGSNVWTANEVRLLNVVEGEDAEVCFEQNGKYGTQVDNVHIDAISYPLCPIRWMYWQGNYFNQIPVLRSASGQGCPAGVFGRYCIRVFDGSAWKQECIACDDKTCQPYQPFVCRMCLDLASPNDTPGLENAIKVSINVGTSSVRQVTGQGGTNGCILNKKEVSAAEQQFAKLERRKEEARGLTSASLQRMEMAEVEKIRREILTEITSDYKKRAAVRSGPYTQPGQTQSVFPVLCLKYRVCVSEACLEPVCFDVDCTEYGTCSYEDIIALAQVPFDCPNLPGNLGLTLYSKDAEFNYTTGQLKPETGCQVRGPTGQMLLDQETCVWSAPKFVGPSYENVGNAPFSFPVLRTNYQIRLDENTIGFEYGTVQPDPLQHPYSTAQLDCNDSDECSVSTGSLVSKWQISSERGLPEAPDARLAIKFGDNSQNVIRNIPAFQLLAPAVNEICVLSDKRPWYVALWGTWSSRGANLPFDSCASETTTLDFCPTSIHVPPRSK